MKCKYENSYPMTGSYCDARAIELDIDTCRKCTIPKNERVEKPIVDVIKFEKNDSGACLTLCKKRKKETVMVGSSTCSSCPKNIATDSRKMVVACKAA